MGPLLGGGGELSCGRRGGRVVKWRGQCPCSEGGADGQQRQRGV